MNDDLESLRIHPIMPQVLAVAKEAGRSDARLLNWLLREHLDFDTTPAAALADEGDEVLAALYRAAEPETYG